MKTFNARARFRPALVVAVLGLAVAALGGTSAGADTGPIEYQCAFGVVDAESGDTIQTEGALTASFDTAISEGQIVNVGDEVSLSPFTGELTFPEAFVTSLREDAGLVTVSGLGETDPFIPQAPGELSAVFDIGPLDLPTEGGLTIDVAGTSNSYVPHEDGVHTVFITAFGINMGVEQVDGYAYVSCTVPGGVPVAMDTLDVVDVVAPTTTTTATPSATATPKRPVLVQTDFAEGDGGVAPLLGVGALVILAAGIWSLFRARGRTAPRQH